MLTQINNDRVKSLLHKIKSLVVDGRIADCTNYHKLLDELTVLSPTTANRVNKEMSYKPGWLFCGADFSSLEDYISALTTKDPNKLRVYAGFKQFDVTVNGITHRIRDTNVVSYDGQQITGEELYEKLQGCKPRDVHHF